MQTNAREALIAEILGDIASLLERVEALAPTLEALTHAAVVAAANLQRQLDQLEERSTVARTAAASKAARLLATQLNDVSSAAADAQARLIGDAARAAVQGELKQATAQLARLATHVAPQRPLCRSCWWHHAITAVLAGCAGWKIAVLMGA